MSDKPKKTVVFDLDDTLYNECDYLRSGKLAVAKYLENLFGRDLSELLRNENGDFLAAACADLGLPSTVKNSLLWVYRLHLPSISLRDGVVELWHRLKSDGAAICILTDGRVITQRLKIASLGLRPDGVYISEALGAEKPSTTGFLRIMQDFPAEAFTYIADNPKKDFIAPRRLGWRSIGVLPKPTNIHLHDPLSTNELVQPDRWVAGFYDLLEI